MLLAISGLLPVLALANAPIDLSSIRQAVGQPARGTVVAFLSAHCPCSASHEVVLKELSTRYSKQGFAFIGVHANADETAAEATTHFKASGLPFPILEDPEQKLADAFGALKTPHVYVLNPKGDILYQGGVDESHIAAAAKNHYLENAMIAVSQGREPDPKEVRVLGCAIKRH